MGFFDHLKAAFLGANKADPVLGSIPKGATKESLIRELVKMRVRTNNLRVNPDQVDDLPIETLMALPEATIFTIVEVFSGLRIRGYEAEKAVVLVEEMRQSAGKATLPNNPTLTDLIRGRLQVEHPGDPISDTHSTEVARQAFAWFAKGQDPS